MKKTAAEIKGRFTLTMFTAVFPIRVHDRPVYKSRVQGRVPGRENGRRFTLAVLTAGDTAVKLSEHGSEYGSCEQGDRVHGQGTRTENTAMNTAHVNRP